MYFPENRSIQVRLRLCKHCTDQALMSSVDILEKLIWWLLNKMTRFSALYQWCVFLELRLVGKSITKSYKCKAAWMPQERPLVECYRVIFSLSLWDGQSQRSSSVSLTRDPFFRKDVAHSPTEVKVFGSDSSLLIQTSRGLWRAELPPRVSVVPGSCQPTPTGDAGEGLHFRLRLRVDQQTGKEATLQGGLNENL